MNTSIRQQMRQHRGARLAAVRLVGAVLAVMAPLVTPAATINNKASVSYQSEGAEVTRQTNLVSFEVLPKPTPASIQLLKNAPDAAGSFPIMVEGGQCRVAGGGFIPLPNAEGTTPRLGDLAGIPVVPASRYEVGTTIVVAVTDATRNADPAVHEYADVEVTASTGDTEVLRMRETGADTGVFAATIQTVQVPPAATAYDCVLSVEDAARIVASYANAGSAGTTLTAEAVAFGGVPTDIKLEQTASKDIVEIGDFVQYTLTVYNVGMVAATNVEIRDILPQGLRYQPGTLRVGDPYAATPSQETVAGRGAGGTGIAARGAGARPLDGAPQAGPVEPALGNGGLEMLFNVGDLQVGEAVKATFVAAVTSGVSEKRLVNYAIATANGALSSNETDTMVRMVESLNTLRFTIIGRVLLAGTCDAAPTDLEGVPNVRLLMQDGTFATTDVDGSYHFEGVRPGTHVVQVDQATLPPGLEIAPCIRNTRFAGRGDSQFVEAQGGSLVRADFHVRRKAPVSSTVGIRLQLEPLAAGVRHTIEVDGGAVPVEDAKVLAVLAPGSSIVPGSASVDGAAVADPEVTGNFAIFRLGDPGADWRRRIVFETTGGCERGDYPGKATATFKSVGASQRTPTAEALIRCRGGPGPAAAGERVETTLMAAAETLAALARPEGGGDYAILDDVAAAGGGDIDWLRGQAPGQDWLFPAEGHNPRSPATRVVIKHMQGESVELRLNGEAVDAIRYDGLAKGANGLAASTWRSIPLREGDNLLEASVVRGGEVVAQLSRHVHYANDAVRAQLVPEHSTLVADGIRRPVIAVRMLDRFGKPVRHGATGDYTVLPPYQAAQSVEDMQRRQLLGMDSKQRWLVRGDDGIAWIELEPTGTAGMAKLGFDFHVEGREQPIHEDIEAWLKSAPRDWIVVGFAKGSIGYETLQDNMQALPPGEDGKGLRGDGQVSLYAKGRVMGKWLLTMAYDSDKDTDRLRNPGLLSTIDPGQYYTLYGDGSQQGYDAASARKLYLKLERDQFYVLFGDYQSGMDRNELSRYQRTLNGMKVEYRGPLLEVNAFAARTSQSNVRDEIQGDGTSGLYRLKQRRIVMNSERIRIETRERYHSEQILDTREMVRHIDYDIDYENGTLLFRQPIASRDFDFNPIWIVAEYETEGAGEEFLNGGTRVGIHAMEGRLEAGASYIRDEDANVRGQLAGIDAKFRLTPNDELRAEAATSRVEGEAGESRGNAWLVEWEHRGEALNFLVYARRQGPGFGLGQQNRFESGMFKTGVQGQYRLGSNFSLQGEVYRQEDLARGYVRDVASLDAVYRTDRWSANAGLKVARDESAEGEVAESRQVTLGASRYFMDGRIELGVQADLGLGGKNESVDFPTMVQLNSAFKVNESLRLLAAQEFTDGKDRDTSTTRLGFEARPWKDATLTSTLNQSRISEYGPRTFALFGLNQRFVVNERWSFDVGVDSSRSFNESGDTPLVVDPSQPIQAGGIRDGGALTEDYLALTGGVTYRTELWMWNARLEGRDSERNDRYGFTTAFLRQIRDGVALSASAQAFSQHNDDGSTGILANAQLSWAWRPLGGNWSILDKLEYRLDQLKGGTGEAILGNATIATTGNARSARLINNFVLNYASAAWAGDDGAGSVLDLYQRSQLSLYYGSKYVIDSYGPDDYAGYSDLLGAEYRFDLTPRIDVGIRASLMHSWSQDTYAWAFGPSVGFTPFTNAWVSVGYNIRGFNDRDFESSHYTAQGAYLVFRMKFDQGTFGLDRAKGAAH